MIICKKCLKSFEQTRNLAEILEVTNGHSDIIEQKLYNRAEDLGSYEYEDCDEVYFEVFLGCPNCMTDKFLQEA